MFEHVSLITSPRTQKVASTLDRLTAYLQRIEKKYSLCEYQATPDIGTDTSAIEAIEIDTSCDLLIAIGGDGTMLRAAALACLHGMPILGINQGKLGFLADIPADTMENKLQQIFAGQFITDERFLLHAEIFRKGSSIFQGTALNDVILQRQNVAKLIEFETYVDDSLVHRQRADGMIISSPTGSTAYALSGGGPILYPSLNALELVPICPHSLTNRPIVIAGDSIVKLILGSSKNDQALMTCDGNIAMDLLPEDHLCVRKKDINICLIHPTDHDHFNLLRAKLKWGTETC